MLLAPVLLLAAFVGHVLSSEGTTNSVQSSSFSRLVETTVINTYANISVNAFVSFEESRVNRVKYGEHRRVGVVYKQHDDFIVQFKTEVTDANVPGLLDYGFLQEPATEYTQVFLVITAEPGRTTPTHVFLAFESNDIEEEFSKLYFLNAISTHTHQGGVDVNVYALYHRPNLDGSHSESVTQLALGVAGNTGKDIDLEPNIELQIKVFPTSINSVEEFKENKELAVYKDFWSLPGKRQFMFIYGICNSTVTPPQITLLGNTISGSQTIMSSVTVTVYCVLGTVTMVTFKY